MHKLYGLDAPNAESKMIIPCDIIENVTLMGGATHLNKNKGKYISIFRHVVNGIAKNVYSKNDDVLKLYIISENQWHPIGRECVLLYDPRDK